MKELLRDSIFGHCLRLITRGKVFQYPEEVDPSIWKKYVHAEKSANIAKHGQTAAPVPSSQGNLGQNRQQSACQSGHSSATEVDHDALVSGEPSRHVDPEKGRDQYIVDWYGPSDPEVSSSTSTVFLHGHRPPDPSPEPAKLVPSEEVLRDV